MGDATVDVTGIANLIGAMQTVIDNVLDRLEMLEEYVGLDPLDTFDPHPVVEDVVVKDGLL